MKYTLNGGVEISASVSKVAHHSVDVKFTTAYNGSTVTTFGIIYNDHGNYSIVNALIPSECSHNFTGISRLKAPYSFNSPNLSYDPGGNYYYYVPSSGVGSGSQTWTYWYVPGATWSSDSTADAPAETFFATWSAPFLILLFGGFPEILFGFSLSASNTLGWSNGWYMGSPQIHGSATSGYVQVSWYYGTVTTVTVDITWTYFGGAG